ncbi:MAG: class I SAM-dependent methyltransferase [Pirellulales bacterium]|nr:class I SAM-dependent methyltransferase [Pirellulales bacterium]
MTDATNEQNARAWDALARRQAELAKPARDEDFGDPLKTVDPLGWLGATISGRSVLCLAAGGGRQSALYAAAGAKVTVVDISTEMLALDRQVATERNLAVRTIQASMEALPMLADAEFDITVHPVSTCYVAEVGPVFREVARVTRGGGLYVSQHKSPASLQTGLRPEGTGYQLHEAYYRDGPLPATDPSRLREPGTLEFLHRWEELLGGLCRAGFVIEDLIEPLHADSTAEFGTFGHRSRFVAPYVRVKARKMCTNPGHDKQSIVV